MPEHPNAHVIVLWGVSEEFPMPQFVGAWSGSLAEVCDPAYVELRDEAIEWFTGYGDEPAEAWMFFTTDQWIARPEGSPSVDQIVATRGGA
jgi:hypothetical protein